MINNERMANSSSDFHIAHHLAKGRLTQSVAKGGLLGEWLSGSCAVSRRCRPRGSYAPRSANESETLLDSVGGQYGSLGNLKSAPAYDLRRHARSPATAKYAITAIETV
jgi:hypothetical protein